MAGPLHRHPQRRSVQSGIYKTESEGRRADPAGRARMRLWTKAIDEILHPMCGEITFACSHRHTVARLGPEGLASFLASTPPVSVTAGWHDRKKVIVKEGLSAPGI